MRSMLPHRTGQGAVGQGGLQTRRHVESTHLISDSAGEEVRMKGHMGPCHLAICETVRGEPTR